MIELSASRLSVFKGCPWKYKLKYIDKLDPIQHTGKEISVGSVVHDAFYLHYNGVSPDDIKSFICKSFDEQISKSELVDHEDYTIARWIALGMYVHYPWVNDDFATVLAEESFKVRVRKKYGVRLIGYIDRIVEQNGSIMIGETKTTGMSQEMFEQRCQVAEQASAYIYGARAKGIPAVGVMYDIIKRPQLRKRVNETADDFGQRIFVDYADKEKKKMYFARHYTYRNEEQLRLFEEDIIKTVDELRWRTKHNAWYRNTDDCFNYNRECPYRKICFCEKPDQLTLQLFYKQGEGNDREREREKLRSIIRRAKGTDETSSGASQGTTVNERRTPKMDKGREILE
jgi:hypothetical protein